MKKKEELIRDLWIKLVGQYAYMSIKDMIDCDGYILEKEGMMMLKEFPSFNNIKIYDWEKFAKKEDLKTMYMRPYGIGKILNNNGWICVKSKSDMPKEDCLVKICMEGKVNSVVHQWFAKDGLLESTQLEINGYRTHSHKFWLNTVSHYKIYIPEPEPIY